MPSTPPPEAAAAARLEYHESENPEIAARLGAEIAARFGARDETPLSLVARDADGAVIAGLNGVVHWRWLYVRHLWVAEAARGQGLGSRLLAAVEQSARDRGARGAYIDTFDEAAARFYERAGYRRHGRIEDFPPGFARVFLARRF